MKPKKSYTNRFRTTKNGTILRRKAGENHFNAKHPRRKELKKHKPVEVDMKSKHQRRFLPGTPTNAKGNASSES